MIKILFPIIFFFCTLLTSCGQENDPKASLTSPQPASEKTTEREVGGPCDRCNEMFYGGKPPDAKISSELALGGKGEKGELMHIKGNIVMSDGKTPAKDVILYIYHTDARGYYSPSDTQTIIRFNGHLRGWAKTDASGNFSLNSIRPAPYPTHDIPAHIHILVKERGLIPYYIDEIWFDDDPLVTRDLQQRSEKRGGDLVIHLAKNSENTWTGDLTIVLGKNIPGYDKE